MRIRRPRLTAGAAAAAAVALMLPAAGVAAADPANPAPAPAPQFPAIPGLPQLPDVAGSLFSPGPQPGGVETAPDGDYAAPQPADIPETLRQTPPVAATPFTVATHEATVGTLTDEARERIGDAAPGWLELIRDRPNAHDLWAVSPSMGRTIPMVWLHPEGADPKAPRPTMYVLNGADGGEGRASWLYQTDILDYFNDKNVNVVIVQAGKFSYYTDWENQGHKLGRQYWETFLTQELPRPLEAAIGSAGQPRGIVGMSMSATSTLLYAQHHRGLYDAVASFSGCAATSDPLSSQFVELVVNRADATGSDLWGQRPGPRWTANDALVNSDKLRDTPLFISNGSGMWGEWDTTANPRVQDESQLTAQRTTGVAIEAAANACTHDLKAKLDHAGIKDTVIWDLANTGTHSWGYWQDDLHQSWEQLFAPVFSGSAPAAAPAEPAEPAEQQAAPAEEQPAE
ncbi:alpha/beta hydrolase [Corynebacterium sp. 335C]